IISNSSLVKVNPLPSLVLSPLHHLTSYFGLSPFQLTKLSSFVHPPLLRCSTTISSITFQSTRYFFSIIHNNLLHFNLPSLPFELKHLLHLTPLLVHLLFAVSFLQIAVLFSHEYFLPNFPSFFLVDTYEGVRLILGAKFLSSGDKQDNLTDVRKTIDPSPAFVFVIPFYLSL